MPRTFLDNQARWFPEGSLADLPDIEADRSRWRILGWELEPGDAVFFHMLTLHASGGVGGDRRRRAFSVRFLARTCGMRRAPGGPRRSFRGWSRNCRRARRWSTRCFRCCGRAPDAGGGSGKSRRWPGSGLGRFVQMFGAREAPGLHFLGIGPRRGLDAFGQRVVALHETGGALEHAQHVVHHQHLSVA